MARYIALLRGVNVGGNNIINMAELKAAFAAYGFANVKTYINSGNILFKSDLNETDAKTACEQILADGFGLFVPVFVISAVDLIEAVQNAPAWWDKAPDTKHNAIFVIPPMTVADIFDQMGATNEAYERAAHYGNVIFWSAPLSAFSRTRFSKIVKDKAMYAATTIRNANTTRKLAELAGDAG